MKAARYPVASFIALSTILVVGSTLPTLAAGHARPPNPSGASLANSTSIQFGLPTTYPVSNVVVVLADLDGGLPDMLYASGPNIVMRSNLGHLAFGSETSIPLAPSGDVTSFVVADLNGDGRGDLVGLSTTSQLLVRMSLGAGAFAPTTAYTLPAPGNGLVAANLSGDPHPEIAVAHIDSGWVSVWPNHDDGTFGSPAIVSIGAPYPMYPYGTLGLTDIVAGHFDSDTHLDLAVLDQHPRATVSVLINRGDGTFAPSLRSPGLSGSEDHVATGDLNEDGLDDLVIGTQFGRIAVVLNKGGGSFAPVDSMTNLYNGGQFIRPAMADLDGDGHADVVASYELNESDIYGLSYLAVWHGMGNGHFFGEVDEKIDYEGGDAVIADLDGDGKLDVVAVTRTWLYESGVPLPEQSAWVFAGHGTGGLEGYGTFFTTGASCGYSYCPRLKWVMARTRARGRSDLLINQGGQVLWRKNRGPGVFDTPVALPFGGLVEARDLNGDGRDDLVLTGMDSVGIALSTGDASWAAPEWYLGAQLVSLADFDGDGDVDLAVRNSERRLLYRPGIGSGRFDSMVATSFVFPGNAGDVDLGDTDGDRRADIVLGVSGPGRDSVIVFGLPPGGGVDTLARIELPCASTGSSCYLYPGHPRIARAGSGRTPNLYVMVGNVGAGDAGDLLSYHRQADGSYAEVSRWPTLREPEPLGIADFDLDGVDDVILTHGEDIEIGTVEIYRGDPSGALEHVFSHKTGSYEGIGSAAFMDDDSRPDLVIEHGYPFGRTDFLLNRTFIDDPTPALLALISATAQLGVVRLDWFGAGSSAANAEWQRRTTTTEWRAIGEVQIDGSGHFRVEDRDVIAGGRYAYRLVPAGADPTPEVWVTVPGGVTALLGVRPNPILRDAAVDFALAADGDVKLDVIDLLGRHVAGATMRFAAGSHSRPVPGLDHLHPGVYLLRFESGGRVESRRFAVIR